MAEHRLTELQKTLAYELSKFALQFASAISFGPSGGSLSNNTLNSATITLLQLGGRRLGVTNQHVIQGYRDRSATGESLLCQIGNEPIDLESSVISECARQDLAVLNLEGINPNKIRGSKEISCQFYEPSLWPAPAPKIGDFVLFGGFPGVKREEDGEFSFVFGAFSSGATEVISVQSDVITCSIQIDQCMVAFDRDGRGLEGLPGISGSPVMASRELESGIVVFDLVGVVFEYNEALDVLRARPLSIIDEYGSICG